MFDAGLILDGVLAQFLVVTFLLGAEFTVGLGTVFAAARILPEADSRSPKRAPALAVVSAHLVRVLTSIAALVLVLVPFAVVLVMAGRHTTSTTSSPWLWTATGVGGLFALLTWLFIIGGKAKAAKIVGRALTLPRIDSLGGNVRELPRGDRVAADRLRWSVGKALNEIEFMFGSRLEGDESKRTFATVIRFRTTLPGDLRLAAYLNMLKVWIRSDRASEPAAQGLIAAARALDRHRRGGSVLKTDYPEEAKQVALDAAAVLISPSDQGALRRLFTSAEVCGSDDRIRPELISATTFDFRKRLKVLSEVIGSAQVLIGAIVAIVAAVITLVSVFS